MHIGVIFPTLELGYDPLVIREYAQAVEALGYQHILLLDHVVGFDRPDFISILGPLTHRSPIHEPLVLLGYLAACTQRVELVTGVLVLPQRQTALVAKQAAEVDVLSGGRLRLGIGVGWVEPEFTALNEDYHTRGARSEEQITVLRALWTQPTVTFHGRWHHLEAAGITPQPIQRPIPLWIGGYAEASLERIARIGDGWIGIGAPDDAAHGLLERLRAYARAADRPAGTIGTHVLLTGLAREPERTWTAHVEGWHALGATHVSVDTMGAGLTAPGDHLKRLVRIQKVLGG